MRKRITTNLSLELLYTNNYLCCRSMIKRHIMEVYFLYFTSLWKLNYKESYMLFVFIAPSVFIVYALCFHALMCLLCACFVSSCINVYFVSTLWLYALVVYTLYISIFHNLVSIIIILIIQRKMIKE